jgi:hypothetical protein
LSFVDSSGPARSFTLAVLGSALTAAAILTALIAADSVEFEPEGLLVIFLVGLIVSAAIIAIVAGLIGMPLSLLLAETGSEEAWVYPAVGLFAGGAIAAGLDRFVLEDGKAIADLIARVAPIGAAPGFVCGALWWFLHRRQLGEPRLTRDASIRSENG